jgi:hypothetical protein
MRALGVEKKRSFDVVQTTEISDSIFSAQLTLLLLLLLNLFSDTRNEWYFLTKIVPAAATAERRFILQNTGK